MQVETKTLAAQFSALMHNVLGRERLAEVNRRNLETGIRSGICHSHDFIDANEVMLQAFQDVACRWPDAASEQDAALQDAAWQMAKESGFARPAPRKVFDHGDGVYCMQAGGEFYVYGVYASGDPRVVPSLGMAHAAAAR